MSNRNTSSIRRVHVSATPQFSVSRSVSPSQLINRGREVLVLGPWAALSSGAWDVHDRRGQAAQMLKDTEPTDIV